MNPGHRIRVVTRQRPNLLRGSVILVTLIAWFSISNHCVLGTLQSAKAAAIHASCHGGAPAPSKTPAKDQQLPCCKVLRATLVTITKSFAVHDASTLSLKPYFVAPIVFPERFPVHVSFEFDTGPPFAGSFAESVLQRSILAHAPPSSLS